MPQNRIRFTGSAGNELVGRITQPPGTPWASALFAHCFTCSKDLKAVRRITAALCEAGIAVLAFDFTGLGESAGEFTETGFTTNIDDLVAAAEALEDRLMAPAILIGHSLGGAAVIAAAHRIPAVQAVVTINAPSDLDHLAQDLERRAPELDRAGAAEIVLGGKTVHIRRQLLDDLRAYDLTAQVAELGRPLLIFHSPADETVAVDHARRIFEAARHPKSFISLDRADHLLLRDPQDAAFVGRTVAAWASRYVTPVERERATPPSPGAGEVWVQGDAGGFRTTVHTHHHSLVADEPEAVGGSDSGPNPYDLLLASLGACTSMTLKMYAGRKEWPLESVTVRLRHSKIHARDCSTCSTQEGKIDRIERDIEVVGPLSSEQRQRLLAIADRCPVHRTLTNETDIVTKSRDPKAAAE